jgi:hypothetical protein
MTPKEKADQLIEKYKNINHVMFDLIKDKPLIWIAKTCALILVNEMLNDHLSNKTTDYGKKRYHFWQKVKLEIEKL